MTDWRTHDMHYLLPDLSTLCISSIFLLDDLTDNISGLPWLFSSTISTLLLLCCASPSPYSHITTLDLAPHLANPKQYVSPLRNTSRKLALEVLPCVASQPFRKPSKVMQPHAPQLKPQMKTQLQVALVLGWEVFPNIYRWLGATQAEGISPK